LLPSAKCTRPLFQGRTGCGGRPSGWHDIVTCQRLVFFCFVAKPSLGTENTISWRDFDCLSVYVCQHPYSCIFSTDLHETCHTTSKKTRSSAVAERSEWCEIELYLQCRTNRKSYVVYQTAPFSMTLNNQFSRSRHSLTSNISQTALDTAIHCTCYKMRMGNCIQAFEWCHLQ